MFSNILLATDWSSLFSNPEVAAGSAGMLGFLAGMIVLAIIVGVALYVYMALALQTIGKKLKYKNPWLAWIPIANNAMLLELGGFHWAWIFLLLIPFAGWVAIAVLVIISLWKIFEKRNYPGWLALLPVLSVIPVVGIFAGLAYLVVFGMVAWKDR
jgi:hypothetical protein